MMITKASFAFLLCSGLSFASSNDLVNTRNALLIKKDEYVKNLRDLSILLVKLKNKPKKLRLAWEKPERKNNKLFKLQLRNYLNKLELTNLKLDQINSEIELAYIKNHLKQNKDQAKLKYNCSGFSIPNKNPMPLKIKTSFGKVTEEDSGLSWNSEGWWVELNNNKLIPCNKGKVVFYQAISGRNHVLIVEHSKSFLSVYGNLDSSKMPSFKKGQKIDNNFIFHFKDDMAYIEYRIEGKPRDPLKLLNKRAVAQIN